MDPSSGLAPLADVSSNPRVAYYLNLFSPETWAACRDHNYRVSGFSPRQRTTAQKLKPGEVFLCYLVGLSRWCGALRIESETFDDATPVFGDPDPFTVRFKVEPIYALEPEQSVPVFEDELWSSLSLTRDIPKGATGWAVNFRGSLRSIPAADGELIIERLRRQVQEQRTFPLTDRDKRQLARRAKIATEAGTVEVEIPSDEEDDVPGQVGDVADATEEIRESLKVQASLTKLGSALGFKVWIAPGDRKRVGTQAGVSSEMLLDTLPFNLAPAAMSIVEQIDVIWAKRNYIARAFEVEHTTAVYSGILRMADLLALQPNLDIKLHIVAPDSKRDKVLRELRRPAFSAFQSGPLSKLCTYIPYSALEEISGLKHLSRMSAEVLDDYAEHAAELGTRL